MRLEKYVNEGLKLNKTDKDVKKTGNNEWTIFHKNQKYLFKTTYIQYINRWVIYWVLSVGKSELIELPKEFRNFTQIEKTKLFNKLLTAIYQFVKDKKPEIFEFDCEMYLKKYYDNIINRFKVNDKFLNDYFVYSDKRNNKIVYILSIKEMNITESHWNFILNIHEHIKENIRKTGKAFVSIDLMHRIHENIIKNHMKYNKGFISEEVFKEK